MSNYLCWKLSNLYPAIWYDFSIRPGMKFIPELRKNVILLKSRIKEGRRGGGEGVCRKNNERKTTNSFMPMQGDRDKIKKRITRWWLSETICLKKRLYKGSSFDSLLQRCSRSFVFTFRRITNAVEFGFLHFPKSFAIIRTRGRNANVWAIHEGTLKNLKNQKDQETFGMDYGLYNGQVRSCDTCILLL